MAPRRIVVPLECSDGFSPRKAINWRGLSNRAKQPTSATITEATISEYIQADEKRNIRHGPPRSVPGERLLPEQPPQRCNNALLDTSRRDRLNRRSPQRTSGLDAAVAEYQWTAPRFDRTRAIARRA